MCCFLGRASTEQIPHSIFSPGSKHVQSHVPASLVNPERLASCPTPQGRAGALNATALLPNRHRLQETSWERTGTPLAVCAKCMPYLNSATTQSRSWEKPAWNFQQGSFNRVRSSNHRSNAKVQRRAGAQGKDWLPRSLNVSSLGADFYRLASVIGHSPRHSWLENWGPLEFRQRLILLCLSLLPAWKRVSRSVEDHWMLICSTHNGNHD